MQTTHLIKHLTEVEHDLTRRRNNALARGNWAKALECDAQEELCTALRKWAAEQDEKTVTKNENDFKCDSCGIVYAGEPDRVVRGTKTYCRPCWLKGVVI